MSASEFARELRSYAFFKNFPDEALQAVARMAKPLTLPAGQYLLLQGQTNNNLYFLRGGNLAVRVDGENVTELSVPGEVLGEMSVISKSPVAASIQALTAVSLFEVGEGFFDGLPEQELDQARRFLERVYATVLTERLRRTNDKAKRFETAHRDLTVAHAKVQQINEHLESEIVRRSSEISTKVRELAKTHLQPAQSLVGKWDLKSGIVPQEEEIHSLRHLITETLDFLKPVTELGAGAAHGLAKRVLLCDPSSKQLNLAKLAMGGTGVELTLVSNVDQVRELIAGQDFDLILCDTAAKEAVRIVRASKPETAIVLMIGPDMADYLALMQEFPTETMFLSRDVANRTFAIKNISTTVVKLLNQDLFGMEKYFSWGAKVVEKIVQSSDDRAELIDEMEKYFRAFGIRNTFLDRVKQVAEELLMNSIYDAPVGPDGKSLYNHLPRTQKVELPLQQQAKFRYGTDGVLLAVSVRDPHGSLRREVIVQYLQSGYAGQDVQMSNKGGAGKGLHIVVESSDQTVFNVQRNKSTEAICLFNLERNDELESKPTMHLFFV